MVYIQMLRGEPDLCLYVLVKFVSAVTFRKGVDSLCVMLNVSD